MDQVNSILAAVGTHFEEIKLAKFGRVNPSNPLIPLILLKIGLNKNRHFF